MAQATGPWRIASDADAALLARAAATTARWNFRMWGFGEGIALSGLIAASDALGDPALYGHVLGLIRGWMGRGVARSNEDHVAPGRELLAVWERERDPAMLDAARALATLNASFTLGERGARCHRPDTPGWRHQIWVDCMHVDGPFLARLALATGEDRYFDQAAAELLGYARTLQDEGGGLFRHGHEKWAGRNGAWWARGNGWALMGLAETLELLPASHPSVPELRERLAALADALAVLQHESGLFPTVLTDSDTYLETTLAAMLAASLPAGPRHRPMIDRARAAVLAHVDEDGALGLVSDATPIGEHHVYATRPFGVFPWGQGPLLLMLTRNHP